jgi:myo-inositol-1(or 4)-monophosphatase
MTGLLTPGDIRFFLRIVRRAGDMALKMQRRGIDVSVKSDSTLVTAADGAVQNYLLGKISRRFPRAGLVYEEEFDRSAPVLDDERMTVVIDPVDGTAVYSMLLPTWCVSVGILQGYRFRYGFVYSPASGLFFHNDDSNAYLNGHVIRCTDEMEITSETGIFISAEVGSVVKGDFPGKVRNLGSTALHAVMVADNARNRLLSYSGASYLWDWAGAIPVVEKAGGRVSYLSGNEFDVKAIVENRYRLPESAVAYSERDFSRVRRFFF